MAKDTFQRTKPHVNVGALFGLQKLGFSGLGVFQISNAQMVTDPQDRDLLAAVLTEYTKSEVKYYTITLTNAR